LVSVEQLGERSAAMRRCPVSHDSPALAALFTPEPLAHVHQRELGPEIGAQLHQAQPPAQVTAHAAIRTVVILVGEITELRRVEDRVLVGGHGGTLPRCACHNPSSFPGCRLLDDATVANLDEPAKYAYGHRPGAG
jgi:hypothetical protein